MDYRKNLPCDASCPSDEAQPEEATKPKESRNLVKEDGACEDNIAHHCDPLINDEAQKTIAKVDDKCGNLHTRKEEDSRQAVIFTAFSFLRGYYTLVMHAYAIL